MDAPFHGGSSDTIGSRVWLRRPEILLSFNGGIQFIAGVIKFFPVVLDTGQKLPKSRKPIGGVNDTTKKLFTDVIDTADKFLAGVSADNTSLPIDLKMKNKQKFNLKV